MSGSRVVVGLVTLGLMAVPHALAGWGWQRTLARRPRALHVLAGCVVAITLFVVTAELLGAVGLFRPLPLVIGSWVAGSAAYLLARRNRVSESTVSDRSPSTESSVALLSIAAVASIAVSIRWLAVTLSSVADGIRDYDSRHYHLPFAAEFVRTGWLTQLHPMWADPSHTFYPATSELFHAAGMMAMGRDLLSPFPNLAWLGLLLLAGWCVGARDGVAPITLLAAAFVAGIPVMAVTNAGAALNDVAILACLVAAVACWRASDGDLGWTAMAGLALGLSVGIKLSAVAPAGTLALCMVALARRDTRRRILAVLAGTMALAGSFWFLRNLVRTGSPIPNLHLPLLPAPDLPMVDRFGFSVADYLFSGSAWRSTFRPGLRLFFGWSGVLAIIGAAVALPRVVRTKDRVVIGLALSGVLGVIAYVFTPYGAWGPKGEPGLGLFIANLRYLLPALLTILLALVLALPNAGSRLRWWFVGWLALAVAFEALRPGAFEQVPSRFLIRAIVVAAILVLGLIVVRALPLDRRLKAAGLAALALVAAFGAGPRLARQQLAGALSGDSEATTQVYRWAASVTGARIGYYALDRHYALYGPTWKNDVVFVGVREPRGGFRSVNNCEEYVGALAKGRFDYVVLGPSDVYFLDLDLPRWTESQPGTTRVLQALPFNVYRVAPPYDPRACPPG